MGCTAVKKTGNGSECSFLGGREKIKKRKRPNFCLEQNLDMEMGKKLTIMGYEHIRNQRGKENNFGGLKCFG